jgi:hypothetical protein
MKMVEAKHVPLWMLLPALKNREVAKRYLANADRILGRSLDEREKAYLEDVIRQGDSVEQYLRELGYFSPGPRGELLRRYGITVKSDSEATEILGELNEPG